MNEIIRIFWKKRVFSKLVRVKHVPVLLERGRNKPLSSASVLLGNERKNLSSALYSYSA